MISEVNKSNKRAREKADLSAVVRLVEMSSVQANCRAETTTLLPFSISGRFLFRRSRRPCLGEWKGMGLR